MASILIGLLGLLCVILTVGSVSAAFLFLLEKSSALFLAHDSLIWALPVFGLVTGLVYWRFGKKIPTTLKVLHQVHDDDARIPFLTALLIFTFTILSQVFGASTGRESTAVQFGAALAEFWRDLIEVRFKSLYFSRQTFLRAGLAAGFGAVFGVPWAGTLFALEVTPHRRWPFRYLGVCALASFGAHWTALAWGAHHKIYPAFIALHWDWRLLLKWLCLGCAFGLAAKIFIFLLQNSERHLFRRISWPWLRPAVGGVLVMLLTLYFHDLRYNGLGVTLIEASYNGGVHLWDFAWKGLFTLLSTGSGLRGGEVTPLMAIGASLGAVLAGWLMVPVPYAASLGLVGVFAACAHIPWTGAVMAWELFGFEAFLPAFLVCFVARRVMGLYGLFIVNE
jgi:H+/Cl- antiporter ClcA